MNILPGNLRFGAGKPIKRLEDQRLLTGKGAFIDDKPEDGALWLHVLRSPHAHAVGRALQDRTGEQVAGRARRLRLRVQQEPARSLLDFRNGRARLHG